MIRMNSGLSRIAEASLAAAPAPPQRYGLSVFLRKAYPALGGRVPGVGRREPIVRGAEVRRVTWKELPADVAELVRKRAERDSAVGAMLLSQPLVDVIRIEEEREVPLQARAPVTVVDVGPNTRVILNEVKGLAAGRARDPSATPQDDTTLRLSLVLLRVGAGARVRWFGASVDAPGFTFVERLAVLARDAVLEQYAALVAANAIRENIHVVLRAPGATARVRTLFAGSQDHQFDLGVTAEHRAPHTVSDLRAKGVLGGKAQGVVRGLVRVAKAARGSDGYQRCDALLLSPTAEVDPIPNLEIETDDVRCTHGVTVSHVNPEHLFYLQSRGFSETAARDLLVEGFTGTILRSYPEQQREGLRRAVQSVLQESP